MKARRTRALALAMTLAAAPWLAAQSPGSAGQTDGPLPESPRSQNPQYQDPRNQDQNSQARKSQDSGNAPANIAPPHSDDAPHGDDSSTNQTRIDLSPPKADELAHPDGGHAADDALHLHEWNPLRAMKDVEVGDYYSKDGNYKAAISRFREALLFKPRDAVATFKLAQALEKSGQVEEARTQYEAYLAILKDGPSAGAARKALQRLKR